MNVDGCAVYEIRRSCKYWHTKRSQNSKEFHVEMLGNEEVSGEAQVLNTVILDFDVRLAS